MPLPDWLRPLTKREENLRAHHGLYPAADGWYKTIRSRKRYIAKPMPLDDVLKVLPARIVQFAGGVVEVRRPIVMGSTTIEGLAEMYLSHLWERHRTGSPRKLSRRTYDDYADVLARFTAAVGPDSPAAAVDPTWFSRYMRTIADKAPTTRRRQIIYLTAFFNWAGPGRHSLGFYPSPVSFGPDFRKPDEAKMRAALDEGSTLYTQEQFHEAMRAVSANRMLYAAGLLALNCAFLPVDLSSIPIGAIDLDAGTHTFSRGKTGIARRGVLMPETIAAIRAYMVVRKGAAGPHDTLFTTDSGTPFGGAGDASAGKRGNHTNMIGKYWGDVTRRPMKGLRTTFATVADGVPDSAAVDLVMGHVANSVRAKHYVKQFDLARVRAVVEEVWRRVAVPVPPPAADAMGAHALSARIGRRADRLRILRSRPAGSGTAAASRRAAARRGRATRASRSA